MCHLGDIMVLMNAHFFQYIADRRLPPFYSRRFEVAENQGAKAESARQACEIRHSKFRNGDWRSQAALGTYTASNGTHLTDVYIQYIHPTGKNNSQHLIHPSRIYGGLRMCNYHVVQPSRLEELRRISEGVKIGPHSIIFPASGRATFFQSCPSFPSFPHALPQVPAFTSQAPPQICNKVELRMLQSSCR